MDEFQRIQHLSRQQASVLRKLHRKPEYFALLFTTFEEELYIQGLTDQDGYIGHHDIFYKLPWRKLKPCCLKNIETQGWSIHPHPSPNDSEPNPYAYLIAQAEREMREPYRRKTEHTTCSCNNTTSEPGPQQ